MYQFQSSRIANEALADPSLRDELIALGLNPTTGAQDGALLALAGDARLVRVDDQLNPSRGYLAAISLEQAGGWLPGSYNYFSTIGEVRGYYTPHERVTVAARARYGAIAPFGPASDVPFFKRFFLGGATSLRGWGRYEVAPLSGSGLPLGGNSLFESSVEVRAQVWGNLGLVAFVDAGTVWSEAWSARFGDLLYDAGPGVRYETPIGPLRLDFAYQLRQLEGLRIDGELQKRPWRIHFSIGHAF
jgi:outer membrane protein insertion porin family